MSETGRPAHLDGEMDGVSGEEFADVYRSETPWLLRFFRRKLGNVEDARDMAQETMVRYIRIAPSTPVATPQAYLRRIASNLLRDRGGHSATRVSNKSVPLLEGLDIPDDTDTYREVESREELAEWDAILRQLPPRTLEIFLLSRVDGFKYKEIAERFGISYFAVNKHMVRAIAHIDRVRRER